MIGKTLGSYRVIEKLGEGGMGAVYVAEHPLLGRRAAIKVLLPHLSDNKEIVDRFFREARAATLIKNPGIVDIFDFGYADDGSAYIVMEFLEGQSLTDRIERHGSMPENEAIRLGRQAAGALAAAHRAGIVHRDLKPDNLFVVSDPEVIGGERLKILDFGIAKLITAGDAASTGDKASMSKTRTGTVMGSPLYMAPEQCRGAEETDARTDIYALGCVLYHAVCGRPPFDGAGVGDVMAKHIYEPPVPPRSLKPEVSAGLEALLMLCLAKKPGRRPQSMGAVIATLDEVSAGRFSSGVPIPQYDTPPAGVPVLSATVPGTPSAISPRKVDTTFGASSGQLSLGSYAPPTRPRRNLMFGVAAAVLAAGAAVAIVTSRSGDTAAPQATAASAPTPETSPTTEPSPSEPTQTTTPATITLAFDSEPSGALVRDAAGKLVGETPYSAEFSSDGATHRFAVSKTGYEPGSVELVADQDRTADRVVLAAVADKTDGQRAGKSNKPRRGDKTDKTGKANKTDKPAEPATKQPKPTKFGETGNPFDQ